MSAFSLQVSLLLAMSAFLLVAGQGGLFRNVSPAQVQQLLFNPTYVRSQLNCVLGRDQCDQIGEQLKIAIPEVLVRQCRSCNAQQARNARFIVNYIRNAYPQEWSEIQAQYLG